MIMRLYRTVRGNTPSAASFCKAEYVTICMGTENSYEKSAGIVTGISPEEMNSSINSAKEEPEGSFCSGYELFNKAEMLSGKLREHACDVSIVRLSTSSFLSVFPARSHHGHHQGRIKTTVLHLSRALRNKK